MPWYRVQDNRGASWDINSVGVAQIVRSFLYNQQLLARSRRVEHPSGSWFLPDTVSYETNFNGLVRHIDAEAPRWISNAWIQANLDGNGLFNSLVDLRQQGVRDGETFHDNNMGASRESQRNINRAVDTNQAIVTGLTHVRNTSASILIAGATVVSGGTATALVAGAGAGLRFTSRIQEGGTVGQAAAETAIDLSVALITRGAGRSIASSEASSTMADLTMAVLGITLNTGADLAKTGITGEAVANPVRGAGARLGVETANALVGTLLSRGIPFLRVVPAGAATEVRDALTSAAFGWVGDRVVDAARQAPSNPHVPENTMVEASPSLTTADLWVRNKAMRRAD